ncbi:outer membrane usher protein [Paralcaligenes ureilyticus]|uniref:Outer membrane usher protein n=2 Tax=Paralcaligenes ureilyticus TaxID=627131 RepID=A0A4R3LXD9_9BURK|nr:outer membrane usher protein [Paralcaligenes ureilyticus]
MGNAVTATAQAFPPALAPTEQKPDSVTVVANTVFLSVKLNGNQDADLVPFTERDGELYLSRESATQLGFSADFLNSVAATTPLSKYPDVKIDYNRGLQSINMTAPFSVLSLSTAVVGAPSEARTVASASPGLMLNYDLYSSYTNQNDANLSGFLQLRAFNNFGVLSDSYLVSEQRLHGQPGWQRSAVRLDTTLEHSLQDKEVTFRLGDTVTNGLSWTRQTRLGGFQISRNFALQPYQNTTPLPAYFGQATLPSAVQLYVNGIQQYNGNVPAGPFELNAMPTVNGAGQAQVVLVDALGRRTSVDFSYYNASKLLRKGLTDWSFETGYVRQNYGIQSFDYGHDPMVSGTIRHGFTNWFTGEGHVEGSKGVVSGGLGASANVGTLGVVSASWAQSKALGVKGGQYSLGYQVQRGPFNAGFNTQRSVGSFNDVASLYGGSPVVRNDSAYVGFSAGRLGNFSLNYALLQQADQPRYRYGGASWSRTFDHGISVSLSANQNLDVRSDRTIYLSVNFSLGKNVSAYTSAVRAQGSDTYTAGASHSASNGGWGWSVQAQKADQQGATANGQVNKQFQYLDFGAGISSAGANQYGYASASGSLVMMGGGVFATRRIYDGFAVVSTDGVPGVPIKNQNRVVGDTNGSGLLLVPSLQSYQHNKISVDPTNLPVNMRIGRVNADVVPRYGSGVNVKFTLETVHAASLILHGPDGKVVPMGEQAFLNHGKEPAGWVGYDGRLYLEGLKENNYLSIQGEDINCTLRFPYKAKADTVPEMGPLLCKP